MGISRRKSGVEVDIFVANLQDHKDSNEIYIYKLYDPIEWVSTLRDLVVAALILGTKMRHIRFLNNQGFAIVFLLTWF